MKKKRILLVDDEVGFTRLLKLNLEQRADYEVRIENWADKALHAAREFRPDIILLDLGLPGLSGFEIAREIRSSLDLHGVILIALTGYGQEEDRRQTRAHGFDDHMVKPIDLDALNALVNR